MGPSWVVLWGILAKCSMSAHVACGVFEVPIIYSNKGDGDDNDNDNGKVELRSENDK